MRSGREGNKKALRNNLEIKKKLKQFWIIFFEKSQPQPFPVKWSVPNKSVTTTKQDISYTTLETQNQQAYPQNKKIYCNTPAMVRGGFRGGVRGVRPPKIHKAYVIQR